MKKLALSLIFVTLVAIGSSRAQTSVNVRGGLNFQNFAVKALGQQVDYNIVLKYHLGVELAVPVAPDFYLQPGLFFSTKGATQELNLPVLGNVETDINLSYLEVPVNFLYMPVLGNGNLILAFGPYLAYAVGGSINDEDITFGNDEDDDMKPFDTGVNISAGYMFGGGISVQFNTQLGFSNLNPGGDQDNSVKNTGFGLSVGYRF